MMMGRRPGGASQSIPLNKAVVLYLLLGVFPSLFPLDSLAELYSLIRKRDIMQVF